MRTAPFLMLPALLLFAGGALSADASGASSQVSCESLRGLDAPGFQVEQARWIAAGRQPAGPGGPEIDLPAHCLLQFVLQARPSNIEGVRLGTGVELRLPEAWNGRLLFQGGGGLNGVLGPALGRVAGAPSALQRGFAVVATDGGHRGRSPVDSSFSSDQQAKLDFAYQSVERSTHEAKRLLQRYYGKAPERSYFMGCSTGGREAMLAAQRLPLEFDGVVAGNPAFNLTRIAAQQVWSLQTVTRVAPRDAAGTPRLADAYSDEQLRAVSDRVLRDCDALDGLADGLVNDYRACGFDPARQQCGQAGAPAAPRCLSPAQVDGLRAIFGGARNSRGESLYGPAPYDTGIASSAWRGMHLGSGSAPPANATLGRDTLRLYAMTPQAPDLDPLKFDFDRDMARTTETAAINDAVQTLHSTFAARGAKLIVYHGLSDQAMSAVALTQWYDALTPRSAGGPQDWARLFLVPGMLHCGGGQATDEFDMLDAIQNWVEKGRAPDRVIARGKAFPGRSRPLCPHPQVARYDGGNPEDAASFSCR